MYLNGPTLDIRMRDGSIQKFSDNAGGQIDAAMNQGGIGVNAYVEPFAGGYLANGCPLNRYFGQPWLPGQREALRAAGKLTCPGVQVEASAPGSSPTFVTLPGPAYAGGGFTVSGRQILPTGVATPSAPIVINTPGGPVADFGLVPPPVDASIQEPPAAGMDTGTMIIIGIALFSLLRRR